MGTFNTKSSLRQLPQPSYQLFTSEHEQFLSCLHAGRQGRDRNSSGKLPWVTQLQLILTLRQLEVTFMHIHTSLSWFTSTFWIDSCLSFSTHLIFSPSNPATRSPILFLDSSFLLTTDNTGVLLVCIPMKVPNWLMQQTARAPKCSMFQATMLQIPMGISARQRWGALLASLGGKAFWGFKPEEVNIEIQFVAALYNWVCWWHYVESACYLPTHL